MVLSFFCAQTPVNRDLCLSFPCFKPRSVSKSTEWHDGLEFLGSRLAYGGSILAPKVTPAQSLLTISSDRVIHFAPESPDPDAPSCPFPESQLIISPVTSPAFKTLVDVLSS